MNPTEQKAHTRRTDELGNQIKDLEETMTNALLAVQNYVREQVGKESTFRNQLADQQRSYVDREIKITQERAANGLDQLEDKLRGFKFMSLRNRLRWLLTGKL